MSVNGCSVQVTRSVVGIVLLAASFAIRAASINVDRVVDRPGSHQSLILTAPPLESEAEAERIYAPIAAYLSHAIGKPVEFVPAGNWGAYEGWMQKGKYDLVLDGPHFNGWRVRHLGHQVLVRVSGHFHFVMFVRKTDPATSVSDLQGALFCAADPPNLATLMLLSKFDPFRAPGIEPKIGPMAIYNGVVEKQCRAGVLPESYLLKSDPGMTYTRIVYSFPPLPHSALSASQRVSPEEKVRIVQAILSPAASVAFAGYHAKYMTGDHFEVARDRQFKSASRILDGYVGF